jgi:hypothetical protein
MSQEEKNIAEHLASDDQTSNDMEVHHHPEVGKKNFKEYLLEGVMIFLAVTMGFLAESLRENLNDKEKETEYITSFIHNLQQDTTNLKYTISDNEKKATGLDSLVHLSFKNLGEPANRQLLYKYCTRYVSFYSAFISDDATMLQLKNSGGLRFVKHSHIADSIAQYDLEMRAIYLAESPYSKAIDGALTAMQELLIYSLQEDTTYYNHGVFTNKELPLLTDDQKKIKIFFNKISDEKGWTQNYVNNLQARLPFATRLIKYLKNEYGLD